MSNSPDMGTLSASASFPGTELQILDDERAVIARGIDRIDPKPVEAGIYTVRAILGTNHTDRTVLVRAGRSEHVSAEAPKIAAAMPVAGTSTTHEYHQAAAAKYTRNDKLSIGAPVQGPPSELFVMAREFNRTGSTRRRPRPERVGGNVILCDGDGSTLFEYKNLQMEQWGEDNCTAKTFMIRSGLVRLCAKSTSTSGEIAHEIPIYTAPDWQTQAYFLASGDGGDVTANDLAQASMTMRRIDRGFNPGDDDARAIESARSALETGSGGVPDEILKGFLWEKFENPLLGMMAAHAMLRRKTLDGGLLATVANNLAGLIGPIPDVVALLLEANPSAQVPPITTPPMLRASWEVLLKHSARRRDLIPRDSFATTIAKRVVGSGAWMVWLRPEKPTGLESLQPASPRPPIKNQEDMDLAVQWLGLPASMLED